MMMMLVMTVLRTKHILPYPTKAQGGVIETAEICDGSCEDEPSNLHFPLTTRGGARTPRLFGDPQVDVAHVPHSQLFGFTHRLLQRKEETA